MKPWKKLTAALLGLCIAGSNAVNVSALQRHPLDINDDSTFDVADIIFVTKYILGYPTDVKAVYAADMDHDGQVDAFDLALLKRALFKGEGIPPEPGQDVTQKISQNFKGASVKAVQPDEATVLGQTKFTLDLLRCTAEGSEGKNILVSPYSVSQALGMTANGAKGDTLAEMETVLGGSMQTLNPVFYSIRTAAPDTEDARLSTANSIWIRNGYPVRSDFLQKNADYYAADAFTAPFDQTTLDDINGWVDEKTDHMVPAILDEIPRNTMMYLINAVAFDAKWSKPYMENEVGKGTFTAADGTEQKASMLNRTLGTYLTDDHATGFLQYYAGGQYAFAAILPEEGMTPEAYLNGLTPERLHSMLAKPEEVTVATQMPEFSYEFGTLLNKPLETMGMPAAFSPAADFTGMTDDPDGLFISRVIHKTRIEVSPVGTRAGAATVVEMTKNAVPMAEKEVILNRPFVYAIVDTQTSLPVFIGTVNSIQS